MFKQILLTQFKWTRTTLAMITVLAFIAPAVAWRLGGMRHAPGARAVMDGFAVVGPAVALLAILGAFMLVVQPWTIDNSSKHVYALSLPITWSKYVGMRFAAGGLTLLVPTLALWFGALLALSSIDMPSTLRAYPGTLALRFLIAALLAHAATFALQYLAGRKAGVVMLVLLMTVLLGGFVLESTGNSALLGSMGRYLTDWPGPLAIFAADWKLVDV